MLEHGVTEVGFDNIAGDGTQFYLSPPTTVAGEDYTGISIEQDTTSISADKSDGTTITYTF
jgi:hypothetical protein